MKLGMNSVLGFAETWPKQTSCNHFQVFFFCSSLPNNHRRDTAAPEASAACCGAPPRPPRSPRPNRTQPLDANADGTPRPSSVHSCGGLATCFLPPMLFSVFCASGGHSGLTWERACRHPLRHPDDHRDAHRHSVAQRDPHGHADGHTAQAERSLVTGRAEQNPPPSPQWKSSTPIQAFPYPWMDPCPCPTTPLILTTRPPHSEDTFWRFGHAVKMSFFSHIQHPPCRGQRLAVIGHGGGAASQF